MGQHGWNHVYAGIVFYTIESDAGLDCRMRVPTYGSVIISFMFEDFNWEPPLWRPIDDIDSTTSGPVGAKTQPSLSRHQDQTIYGVWWKMAITAFTKI